MILLTLVLVFKPTRNSWVRITDLSDEIKNWLYSVMNFMTDLVFFFLIYVNLSKLNL